MVGDGHPQTLRAKLFRIKKSIFVRFWFCFEFGNYSTEINNTFPEIFPHGNLLGISMKFGKNRLSPLKIGIEHLNSELTC